MSDNNELLKSSASYDLHTLKETITEIFNHQEATFFDIVPVLSAMRRQDMISLLNSILLNREIISNYDLLSEDHVYLYRQYNFHLLMRFIGPGSQKFFYANEFDAVIINPTTNTITLPLYKCVSLSDSHQQPEPLIRVDDLVLEPEAVYRLEAYKYFPDFSAETSQKNFVLIAHSEPAGWLSWIYDRQSLAPIESICTNLQASRIQLYVRLLGAMKATEATECLQKLATSDYANFVRWEAVESLASISPSSCLEILKQLADCDSDSTMRQIAVESLQLSEA